MASGHVNRTQRPNTWLLRPSLQREDSPCQLGAVHTWPLADGVAMTERGNAPIAIHKLTSTSRRVRVIFTAGMRVE